MTTLAEVLIPNSDDSDEDDDDYVPSGGDESEDDLAEAEPEETDTSDLKLQKSKKRRKSQKPSARKRKGGISLSGDEDDRRDEPVASPAEEEEKEEEPRESKKKADDLWADFLSDVTPPPKKTLRPTSSNSTPMGTPLSASPVVKSSSKPAKVTITKIFEFAGESVVVKEQVDANSKAAKEFAVEDSSPKLELCNTPEAQKTPLSSKKVGGVSAVLGKVLGKKSRLSTLEKSKLDWNTFKKEEGVEEDLEQYKKGKDGYLERQAFLERADVRQFEIEKQLRTINRSHRT